MSSTSDSMAAANPHEAGQLLGLLAEFDSVHDLFHACERVRDAGYRRWDAHTPFPVHGLNDAMGLKPSTLPWLVLGGGLTGMSLALLMQWWMNAHDYKYLIAGKPYFSLPAFIPVTFELTILLSAFAAFFGMLLLNGLPRYHHPVFLAERFQRASDDRFFISIDADDKRFELTATRALLAEISLSVEELREVEDD